MEFEYDPEKDEINRAQHGVSLKDAEHLSFDSMTATPDTSLSYGEERMVGFAYMGKSADVYCVVFVERGDVFRSISLRKATKREVERFYESQT